MPVVLCRNKLHEKLWNLLEHTGYYHVKIMVGNVSYIATELLMSSKGRQ